MASVTFATGSTTSSTLDLTLLQDITRPRADALVFPTGFVTATVYVNSFSDLGATYQPVYVNGTRYGIAAVAGEEVKLDFGVMDDITNFQLVSSATQTSASIVTVILVDASKAAGLGGSGGGSSSGGGTGTNGSTAPTSSNSTGYTNGSGNQTAVSPSNGLPTTAGNGTVADGSGTITTGNTSQQIFAANASRQYLFIQNNSSGPLWFNYGGAAVLSQPSILLASGQYYESSQFVSNQSVTIIGGTAGQSFTAKQA